MHHQQHTRRRKEGKLISYVYSIQLKSWEIYASWNYHQMMIISLCIVYKLPCELSSNDFHITVKCFIISQLLFCAVKSIKKKRKHFFNQNLYLMIFFSWKLQCYLMHRLFFPNKRNRIYYFSTHFFLIFYLKNFLKNMKDKIQPLSNFHRINFDVHWWRNTEKKSLNRSYGPFCYERFNNN